MTGGYVKSDATHFSRPSATPLGAKFQHGAFSQQQQDQGFPAINKQNKDQNQLPFDWGT
jgi:hypothetical protein